MNDICPWCSAPRNLGPICPRCGADYAKAAAIKAHGRASTVDAAAPGSEVAADKAGAARTTSASDPVLVIHAEEPNGWQTVSDAELEFKFCVAAIPAALLCAILFHASGLGAMLQRTFLTMPVHEVGHAVTGWFCGYTAIPTLWKTLIPETRGFIAPVLLGGAVAYMLFRAWQVNNKWLMSAGAVLLVMQLACTFAIKPETAHMLITFGGDGMGMILAVLLMSSFFFGKDTQLYKGSLRWGFVVIGAAAFIDIYATWWKSRRDEGAIPYGTMDGMASDSMKLVESYGWTLQSLVNRYVVLGLFCLVVLVAVYVWGVWRAKSERDARRLADKREEWSQRKRVT